MKKIIALVLAAMMLLACCNVLADEMPEKKYPDLDFGGATVVIYDWWSGDGAVRVADPDEDTQKLYDYRDWINETYNVNIVEKALSDWAGNSTELANMVMNGVNDELCLVGLAADFAGAAVKNDLYMPWTIDMSADKWNAATTETYTKLGKPYGVSVGNEPRSCVFFNKRVLEEAGIDPESIYDAQADKTWNWDMMLDIMAKVQRDTDNDGTADVYGFTGSNDDLMLGLVFANDASFFANVDGKLAVTAGDQKALDAMALWQTLEFTYAAPQPEGSNWDWFKDYWKQGTTAFYFGQTWQGFNPNSEMADMEDEWGCVAFPMGPAATDYVNMACNNVFGVPNVYDEETALKIQQIYDVYTDPTPGVDQETSWIGEKYNYTDERAVDETYAMLRENEHIVANNTYILGSTNDVMGSAFLWGPIWSSTPAEAVEAAMPVWQDMADVLNGDITPEQAEANKAAREAAAAEAAAAEEAEEVPAE